MALLVAAVVVAAAVQVAGLLRIALVRAEALAGDAVQQQQQGAV